MNAVLLLLPLLIMLESAFLCFVFARGTTPVFRAFLVYFLVGEFGQYAWLTTTELALAFFPEYSGVANREIRATVARSLQFVGTTYLVVSLGRIT